MQTKAEYDANICFFEFFLKELMVAVCFKVVGREFQCFGTMYLNDLWSEVLTTRLLLDPLVLCV